jgi:N-ethylmaleimide reductase
MTLLSMLRYKDLELANRIVMAPMNRRRAAGGVPSDSAPMYYGLRADAGLIIGENSAISPNGIGLLQTPGFYSPSQLVGWKKVVDEVHAKGGKMFIQLVHYGRRGHPDNQEGRPLVAPSAIADNGEVLVSTGEHLAQPMPHALSTVETKALVETFIIAAENAIEVGFDGVEIHGAHGFLIDSFLHASTNSRTDEYGGSIANRSRFLLEVMQGVVRAIGKEHTGIRLSPFGGLEDPSNLEEEWKTFRYVVAELDKLGILYIHLSDVAEGRAIPLEMIRDIRTNFHQLLMLAGGFTSERAENMLKAGLADLIAFGRPFISNPDLVERIRLGVPFTASDPAFHYHGGDKGYIDVPVLYPHSQKAGVCCA